MFQPRLVREADADLILDCMAYLIRRWGLPERPAVPSPLHKSQGLETLRHAPTDSRSAADWAQDNVANVLYGAGVRSDGLVLIASGTPQTLLDAPPEDRLHYDPARVSEPGHFVTTLMLQLVARRMADYAPDVALAGPQKALVLLTACAFMRQGFALIHCQDVLQTAFSDWGVPARAIEAQLLFAACLGLTLRRQTPEQMIATYGSLMSAATRRKVRPACKQLDGYDAEVKLLRTMAGGDQAGAARIGRPALRAQPQRISWT